MEGENINSCFTTQSLKDLPLPQLQISKYLHKNIIISLGASSIVFSPSIPELCL